jgi:hypothetical protein
MEVVIAVLNLPEGHYLVTIYPKVDYRTLREQYAVTRHTIESLDGGVVGLSTCQLATDHYFELTGVVAEKLFAFGIAEIGSRVPNTDR